MILHDTPYGETYRILRQEQHKVEFAALKFETAHAKDYPEWNIRKGYCMTTYTVPASRNRYLIWLKTETDHKTGRIYLTQNSFLSTYDKYGRRMFLRAIEVDRFSIYTRNKEKERWLIVITGHCLHRYAQRSGLPCGSTDEDILVRFNNEIKTTTKLPYEEVGTMENNELGFTDQCDSGVIFGTTREDTAPDGTPFTVRRYNTFVDKNLLRDAQKRHVLKAETLRKIDLIIRNLYQ